MRLIEEENPVLVNKDASVAPLKTTPKLNMTHIQLTPSTRMKVSLAAQVNIIIICNGNPTHNFFVESGGGGDN